MSRYLNFSGITEIIYFQLWVAVSDQGKSKSLFWALQDIFLSTSNCFESQGPWFSGYNFKSSTIDFICGCLVIYPNSYPLRWGSIPVSVQRMYTLLYMLFLAWDVSNCKTQVNVKSVSVRAIRFNLLGQNKYFSPLEREFTYKIFLHCTYL